MGLPYSIYKGAQNNVILIITLQKRIITRCALFVASHLKNEKYAKWIDRLALVAGRVIVTCLVPLCGQSSKVVQYAAVLQRLTINFNPTHIATFLLTEYLWD